MDDKTDKERGILIRIISNREIQKGIAFFSIALILAFSAILPVAEEDVDTDTVDTIDDDPQHKRIDFPGYRLTNATIEFNITSIVESYLSTSRVSILDHEFDILYQENITSNETKSWDLIEKDLDGAPSWIYFENITLEYTYTLNYERRPYSLLSIPALLFTFIGMVFAFRGKGIILGEIKQKQMEEEAKKKMEERDEGSDEKTESDGTVDMIDEEDVIYQGEGVKEMNGDTDHVNFMGIPDEDEEEEDGGE